ncbi:ImmA/IrrE family metallo-endopeptidase [Alkaliphilus pronyensis]|uniref:ImmA/IrrE family metallo-endopeptidase n=1 Tax=Alkaliphilus pronyensis TaxID=1482732 RepID=A0A6I0F2T5_9FIRM|nr:ImmA/IrrE family metallo-endopeptidase [Alkaliphilus pronyensis]KAB3535622.1 ImmA/IrrE family metallo-endopeptidase [Alkaliphilus pronyensis]
MVPTENLDLIIQKCRIFKKYAPLPDNILGYYYYDGDYYIILINNILKGNERLYRTVLAEEIGHYRTTIGDITPRKYMCNKDRLEIDKKELLALRWACDFLIPTDSLIELVKNKNAISLADMADYFMVTEEFMMKKFEFMAKIKAVWDLDSNRKLCLFNLPSVFIYEGI